MVAGLDWEEATPQQLQNMLDEGKSYAQIAKAFGVTRNKVSGKVFRWRGAGYMAPAQSRSMAGKSDKPLRPKLPTNQPFTLTGKTLRAPPPAAYRPPAPTKARNLTPPSNPPVPPLKLEDGMCAYVVQERPYLYCGCRDITNTRYRLCGYHEQGFFDRAVGQTNRRKRSRLPK